MHNHGRVEFHLSDVAQLNGVRESRQQQRLRCRARKIAGTDARNYQKENHTDQNNPHSRPQAHPAQGSRDVLHRDRTVSLRPIHIEAHQGRDQSHEEQK